MVTINITTPPGRCFSWLELVINDPLNIQLIRPWVARFAVSRNIPEHTAQQSSPLVDQYDSSRLPSRPSNGGTSFCAWHEKSCSHGAIRSKPRQKCCHLPYISSTPTKSPTAIGNVFPSSFHPSSSSSSHAVSFSNSFSSCTQPSFTALSSTRKILPTTDLINQQPRSIAFFLSPLSVVSVPPQ